jgi:anti-sigma regulatory factor (Ser/Thr protein kinase)
MPLPAGEHAVFPARLAALPETATFAREFCDRNGVSRDDALRLTLIIEELFTNTVEHGYRSQSDAPIRVTLSTSGPHVTILYEDAAPAYDPLALIHVKPSSLNDSVDDRPLGGLGGYILGRLIVVATYSYEHGNNRLWLTMPREDPPLARQD